MKALVVLGEGGHTAQMLKLVDLLGPLCEYSYLMAKHDLTSEAKIEVAGPVYRAHLPRTKSSKFLANLKFLMMSSIEELSILIKARPNVIISAGAGIAVPISIWGRIAGVKIIYVEDACRVRALSLTGKIMYRIAHLFFVQWEPLKEKYSKAIYAGRLL